MSVGDVRLAAVVSPYARVACLARVLVRNGPDEHVWAEQAVVRPLCELRDRERTVRLRPPTGRQDDNATYVSGGFKRWSGQPDALSCKKMDHGPPPGAPIRLQHGRRPWRALRSLASNCQHEQRRSGVMPMQ
jgi:hypothetical protein